MPHIGFGDIGIFLYNGDAYCKKLDKINGRPCLTSINPRYTPIFFNDSESIYTFGKVIL